jgi:hypothetical protein
MVVAEAGKQERAEEALAGIHAGQQSRERR